MLACKKKKITADRAWRMTVADLLLSISEPASDVERTDQAALYNVQVARVRQRLARLKAMTTEERIEFERFKAALI